jgi:hypothetical protein
MEPAIERPVSNWAKLGRALCWIFGTLSLLGGAAVIGTSTPHTWAYEVAEGITSILTAAILLPPVIGAVGRRLPFIKPWYSRLIALLVVSLIGGIVARAMPGAPPLPAPVKVARHTAPLQTASAANPAITPANTPAATASMPPVNTADDESTFYKSMAVAKWKMKDVLKDPDSAKYEDVIGYLYVTQKGEKLYIFCGKVNARNGFGGYNGYERFIATPAGGALETAATDFEEGWTAHCVGTPRDAAGF